MLPEAEELEYNKETASMEMTSTCADRKQTLETGKGDHISCYEHLAGCVCMEDCPDRDKMGNYDLHKQRSRYGTDETLTRMHTFLFSVQRPAAATIN